MINRIFSPPLALLFLACSSAFLPSLWAETPIASALQPFVDSDTIPGAVVLVANKDKILDLEAVGYSDVAAKTPMRTDSLFWLASMTKSFTTTCLMMLVDDGKVNVDDPVEKYIPEFKNLKVAVKQDREKTLPAKGAPIQGYMLKDAAVDKDAGQLKKPDHVMTIRELMTHMSGISPQKTPRQITDKDYVPLREVVAGYASYPLIFDPGTSYSYSNHGMDTVGRIIEVASGMSYQDFMEQRLLKPLGMKDTTFWPSDEQYSRLATGYSVDDKTHSLKEEKTIDFFHYPLSDPKRQPWPAGGLFSTATDIAIFCRMLINGGFYEGHRYLSMKSLQQMTSTQTGDLLNKGLNEDGYGFGWQTVNKLRRPDNGLAGPFGHGGAYGTEMWMDPHRPSVRVFMVQIEGGLAVCGPGVGKKVMTAVGKAVTQILVQSKAADVAKAQ